jgi:predicted ATP-grasp superfamily ATP-dependent carboligase
MELLKNYYHFNLPCRSVVKTLMDKAMFSTFAEKNGHQIPKTFVINNLDDVKSLGSEIHYPCIMKPPFKGPTWDSVNLDKAFKVFSEEQLISLYKSNSFLTKKFIIQEWIPGPDTEVYFCLLWYNALSQPGAAFTARKIMQWPLETGSTCIAESCDNSIVQDTSIRLFDAVGYKGIGSVEFKRDPRDDVFKITEPTVGRVDLQSPIAYYAGMNIPLLEYCDCVGLTPPKLTKNNRRIYWVHEENLFWLLRNQSVAFLPKGWSRIIKNRRCYALFNLSDIKPFLSFLCLVGRMIKNKLTQKWSKSLGTGDGRG